MIQVVISFRVTDTRRGEELYLSEMQANLDEGVVDINPALATGVFVNLNQEIQKMAFSELVAAKSIEFTTE